MDERNANARSDLQGLADIKRATLCALGDSAPAAR
jgi:hypothetical protein